jgi:hypothetical protein
VALSREPRLHKTRRALGNNNLIMSGDVIAVGMGNERERLSVPGIEPKIFVWQINAALVTDLDHAKKLRAKPSGRNWHSAARGCIDGVLRFPFRHPDEVCDVIFPGCDEQRFGCE